jgi:hypothetical protein
LHADAARALAALALLGGGRAGAELASLGKEPLPQDQRDLVSKLLRDPVATGRATLSR